MSTPDTSTEPEASTEAPSTEPRPGSDTPLPAFGAAAGGRRRAVLATLIGINTVIALIGFIMITAADGFAVGDILFDGISPLHEWGEFNGPAVDSGEVWRLVTTMVIHYGFLHLLANMVMLALAGWQLEPILGWRRFLVLYGLAGLGASVATYYFDHSSLTAGASGANFGVYAALLLVYIRLRRKLWLPGILVLVGVVSTVAIPGMAVAAHAGGLLLGAVIAAGYAYAGGARRTTIQTAVPIAALVVLLGLLVIGMAIN